MFKPPALPQVLVYFDSVGAVNTLHAGEDFSTRLEEEIRIHEGQIEAENLLLNTVARYQQIADRHDIPREELHDILRENKYQLEDAKKEMIARYGIPAAAFDQPLDIDPVDTKDFMRQRAAMMGAVLSSTPVLLRDPWGGQPATPQYGFSDFKAEIDGVGFSAIATPRYKGIPFRFAVMKHDHDGYADNNPAMIMSDEFCDAFALYNQEKFGNAPAAANPLLVAMATNLKPNIHDRFHNWLLYDVNAASDTFRQWGDDIYFVEHADKNPLLINYEQVAMAFHLYGWQTLFDKNPGLKDQMYDRLEECLTEIKSFGDFLKEKDHPQAGIIEESTVYAVLSNICFVLNPFEERFQQLLRPYPDVAEKLLTVNAEGKGIGATLERLHGFEDGVPSQKYNGSKEAAIEYILRYPLVDELRARLKEERAHGATETVDGKRIYTVDIEEYRRLPQELKSQISNLPDSSVLGEVNAALDKLPPHLRAEVTKRTCISEEGYFFFRVSRDELDYTAFDTRAQEKKVLLVDIPAGEELRFANEKKLSIKDKVRKQEFHAVGGRDVLAINVRDEQMAEDILAHAQTENGIDAHLALARAQELAGLTGNQAAGDVYKIERDVAASDQLYSFQGSGFYHALLEKRVAQAPGPIVMDLPSGGDQRLVKGAFVYIPFGKDPARDGNPDCHLIENVDFRRDYEDARGTDALAAVQFKKGSPLAGKNNPMAEFLKTLHGINFRITHGTAQAQQYSARKGPSLFS